MSHDVLVLCPLAQTLFPQWSWPLSSYRLELLGWVRQWLLISCHHSSSNILEMNWQPGNELGLIRTKKAHTPLVLLPKLFFFPLSVLFFHCLSFFFKYFFQTTKYFLPLFLPRTSPACPHSSPFHFPTSLFHSRIMMKKTDGGLDMTHRKI